MIIGADEAGNKDLVGLWDGYRESGQSWSEPVVDLKSRRLAEGPRLAVGDGALGFWQALIKLNGQTRRQRCWRHKTANVFNKVPKRVQKQAEQRIHEICMAPGRVGAEKAFDYFIGSRRRITFIELPEDDPKLRQPDITRAWRRLNWEPQVSLNRA